MANVRKPIIENTVYCEIMFRLGVYKYYVSQFVDHFRDDWDMTSKPHKEQSVLQRQMEFLREEGYLMTTQTNEEGKKTDKNKKLFFISFGKIIEVFMEYSITRLKGMLDNKELKEYEYKDRIKALIDNAFRKQAKDNILIKYLFSAFMEQIRQSNFDKRRITLKNMFDSFLSTGYFEDKIKFAIFEKVGETNDHLNIKQIEKRYDPVTYIKKELVEDYRFFLHFMNTVQMSGGLNYLANEIFPVILSNILINGFNSRDYSFYRLKK